MRAITASAVIRALIFFPGLVGVLAYRLGHLAMSRLPGPLRILAWLPTRVAGHLVGVEFDPHVHAGPGLFVNHFGNVFVGARSIGSNCNIAHGVTIGRSTTGDGGEDDVPVLGDRVWIGPNAVVAGGITLHDDAVVAANSLVGRDVPPAGVAVGVPARVMARRGSFSQVRYRGMTDDPQRCAALARLGAADATAAPPVPMTPTSGSSTPAPATPTALPVQATPQPTPGRPVPLLPPSAG
jgi:serine O-acetyltransferase